jgi:hypothetical protein
LEVYAYLFASLEGIIGVNNWLESLKEFAKEVNKTITSAFAK